MLRLVETWKEVKQRILDFVLPKYIYISFFTSAAMLTESHFTILHYLYCLLVLSHRRTCILSHLDALNSGGPDRKI